MEKFSLDAVDRELLKAAARSASGRSSVTVYGGHAKVLRQTVITLCAGTGLDEHESPGEASLQVLRGRITLTAGDVRWDGRDGDFLVIPPARHSVQAHEDSALLLTVAKG